MKITRRNFVHSLGAVAAAITVSGAGTDSAFGFEKATDDLANPRARGLFAMTESQVRKLVGSSFIAIPSEGEKLELVLMEVSSVGSEANDKRGYSGNSFSAIFAAIRTDLSLEQGIYEMKSEGIDGFSALLVPTGRRRKEFELVVNNLSR
jgi:hypothetical protein